MSDKNVFGGGNANSLYMPMSETEQEVLERLVAQNDLEIHVVDWGVINNLKVTFGDLRVSIPIKITFNAPEVHIPVYYFDLQLRRTDGFVIFQKRYDVQYGGRPVMIGAGQTIEMIWDIAIQDMDPNFVKTVKPGAVGLTTRVGNLDLKGKVQETYDNMRDVEKKIRENDAKKVAVATDKSLY